MQIFLLNVGQLELFIQPSNLVPKSQNNRSKDKLLEQIEGNLLFLMNQTLEKLKSATSREEAEVHMRTYRFFADEQIRIREISSGSIVWILVFESIDSLDVFWNEYLSGHLKEMFEKDFITNDLLKSAELESADIHIYVSEQDFKTCEEELKGWFGIYIMSFYNEFCFKIS